MPTPIRFRVVPQEEGMTLAHLIARRLPDTSTDQGRALVKAGAVYMGHLRVRVPTVRVVPGERITVYPEALADEVLGSDALRFVVRDPAFVVLDKPAGVPVSATKQSARGTLSEALRRHLASEGFERPYVGVVHRLDRGASGLVLFTIRSVANKSLHRQFVEHEIARTYRVLVCGNAPATVRCEAPLVDAPSGGSRVATGGERRARSAVTVFSRKTPQRPIPDTSLLEVELVTGRTHQIRVHAAHLGHPVYGDARYGDRGVAERLHLHAHKLEFSHPLEGGAIVCRSPLPPWAGAEDDAHGAD